MIVCSFGRIMFGVFKSQPPCRSYALTLLSLTLERGSLSFVKEKNLCFSSQHSALSTSLLTPRIFILVAKCVWVFLPHQEILRHQPSVLQCNSTLTLSTRRQHQVPQVKGLVPPLQMPIACPDCYLCLWPIGYKSGVPITPSSIC